MRIEEFIRYLLESMPTDGWSQISRRQLICIAQAKGVEDPVLCADVCDAIGIGELADGEQAEQVVFSFERPST